jgi:hypothetical protein
MNLRRSLPLVVLTVATILIFSLVLSSRIRANPEAGSTVQGVPLTTDDASSPLTTVPPPQTCDYCTHNLVGKSAAEVGQIVQNLAKQQLKTKSEPQVLLTRLVDAQALADLGLGCGVAFSAIEQPPMIVTILKGGFDFRSAAPGFGQLPPPVAGKDSYVVYVFDAWAGSPAVILPSYDGALVKKALQDPTLPDNEEPIPSVCATPIPASQKHLHYGEQAPGFDVPTHAVIEETPTPYPTPVPPSTAIPVGSYVPVTSTPWAPPPLPTAIVP